jgi:hypothetical protein
MIIFIPCPAKHGTMGDILVETKNEEHLKVQEYVQYLKTKENVREFLDKAGVESFLRSAEKSVNGLTVDVIVRFSVEKK